MNRARVPLACAAAALLAACQTGAGASAAQSGQPSPGSTVLGPGSFGPPPSPTQPPDSTPVVLDASLLDILPETIAGVPVVESTDEAAAALSNSNVPKVASALDAGVAVDAAHGNLVYALVVRLKPGALTDEFFRQWRDSFDEGACTASGGVVANAEATIDERTVYITSCATGMRTYHAWLKDDGVLVSASSVGEGRFGEQLMDSLRVPA